MTLRLVQISDTHISRDHPQRTLDLKRCVEEVNALSPQPDFIVHSGDITHHGDSAEYKTAYEEMAGFTAPFVVMAGNKDNREELLKVFSDEQFLSAQSPFIQYSVDLFSTRIVVVDTKCTNSNKGEICEERFDDLERMLSTDKSKPTALFLHHPPFEAWEIPDPRQFEDWTQVARLSSLVQRFSNVTGIYCGHVHRNIGSGIAGYDDSTIPCSAMTCMAGDLRKGKVSDEERDRPVFKTIVFE